jgi:hypothetical protein
MLPTLSAFYVYSEGNSRGNKGALIDGLVVMADANLGQDTPPARSSRSGCRVPTSEIDEPVQSKAGGAWH